MSRTETLSLANTREHRLRAGSRAAPIRMGGVDSRWWGGFAAAALVLVLAPLVWSDYTLTLMVLFALLALSLGFVWGVAGVLCFGQAAFFGLGAYGYAIAVINLGESTAAAVVAVAIAGAGALALGAMMFYGRISDVYLGVITLVVTLLLFKYTNSTAGSEYTIGKAQLGGFNGIPGFAPLNVPGLPDVFITGRGLYATSVICLLGSWLLLRWLCGRAFGRLLAGLRENELRAELSGYDVRLAKTLAFALGGAVAGLAGVLYACWAEIVTPQLFSLSTSAEIIIWVLVGGVGTLWGPMLGAVVVVSLKTALANQQWVDNSLLLGVLLMVVVLLLPRGLAPELARLFDWLRGRRKATLPTDGAQS